MQFRFRFIETLIIIIFLSSCATSESNRMATVDVTGDWAGTLDLGVGTLKLIFHITESENNYTATIESVDQGNAIIPTVMIIEGDSLTFTVDSLGVYYKATIIGNVIKGKFEQNGRTDPAFTLTRNNS